MKIAFDIAPLVAYTLTEYQLAQCRVLHDATSDGVHQQDSVVIVPSRHHTLQTLDAIITYLQLLSPENPHVPDDLRVLTDPTLDNIPHLTRVWMCADALDTVHRQTLRDRFLRVVVCGTTHHDLLRIFQCKLPFSHEECQRISTAAPYMSYTEH